MRLSACCSQARLSSQKMHSAPTRQLKDAALTKARPHLHGLHLEQSAVQHTQGHCQPGHSTPERHRGLTSASCLQTRGCARGRRRPSATWSWTASAAGCATMPCATTSSSRHAPLSKGVPAGVCLWCCFSTCREMCTLTHSATLTVLPCRSTGWGMSQPTTCICCFARLPGPDVGFHRLLTWCRWKERATGRPVICM